jgi:hypothetical protein
MIQQKNQEDGTVLYTVTDHQGRLIGTTDSQQRAELWDQRNQWHFKPRAGLAAAERRQQNPKSHLTRRNTNG